MEAQLAQLRDWFLALLDGGGRYHVEKLMTIAVYIVACVATVVWVVTSEDADNELGAAHGFETLAPLNQKIFFLENASSSDWTNVRIVLNDNFLYTKDTVGAGERLMLRPDSFRYFWWVPRPWGRHDWEAVQPPPKPGPTATDAITWETVEVRTRQGRLDIKL